MTVRWLRCPVARGCVQNVQWMTDVSEEAVKRRAAEQLSGATSDMVTQGNIEVHATAHCELALGGSCSTFIWSAHHITDATVEA